MNSASQNRKRGGPYYAVYLFTIICMNISCFKLVWPASIARLARPSFVFSLHRHSVCSNIYHLHLCRCIP